MKCISAFMLVLLLTTSGCAALVVGGGGGHYAAADARTTGQVSEDARITASINTQYVRDSLVSAMDVSVATANGVVTLRGKVNSSQAASRAVVLARGTSGVKQVISRLQVVR